MSIECRDDGLLIPEVGPWARRKYHFVGRYLNAFTVAMHEKWAELHYIDLFAGAGLARIRGTSDIVRNCAALAAGTKHPFTQLHLCESNLDCLSALRQRLEQVQLPRPPLLYGLDCNTAIVPLLEHVPKSDVLAVTFVDPFGLHVAFDTIKRIADRRSDLIVLVPDGMDVIRNWKTYYRHDPSSNLDRFLGSPDWRRALEQSRPDRIAHALREFYETRLKLLGFQYFESERVVNENGANLYILLFASRHDAGARIWRGVTRTDEGGQRSLPWA